MKGRKKLPEAVKKLRGTDKKCRATNETELVRLNEEIPGVPFKVEDMTPEQKAIYDAKCLQCSALGIMEPQFQEAMMVYAYWFDMASKAMRLMNKNGLVKAETDESGNITGFLTNPYISILEKCTRNLNMIGSQFGFTPVTKANLHIKEKEINPIAELEKLMG